MSQNIPAVLSLVSTLTERRFEGSEAALNILSKWRPQKTYLMQT